MISPDTLWMLLKVLVKKSFKNIFKNLKMHLIKMLIVFLVVFVVHAWLLVVKNEGFAVDWNNPFAAITNLKGVTYFVPAFWAFFGLFLTVLLTKIVKGPILFFKEIFTTPGFIVKNSIGQSQSGTAAFLVAVALSLLSSLLIKNPYLLLLYSVMIILSLTRQNKSILLLAVKLAWQDWQRVFKSSAGKKANTGISALFLLGLSIGLLVNYILPLKPYSPIILAVMMLVLAVLIKSKKVTARAAMVIISLLALNIILFRCREVFADDGGWREAGGTFTGWVKSPGAGKAVVDGVAPGAAAAGGSLVGGAIPEIDISDGAEASENEGIPEIQEGTIVIRKPEGTVEKAGDGETGEAIILFPANELGGPEDNPYTVFEGNNPCI